jgi:hypothetical protein
MRGTCWASGWYHGPVRLSFSVGGPPLFSAVLLFHHFHYSKISICSRGVFCSSNNDCLAIYQIFCVLFLLVMRCVARRFRDLWDGISGPCIARRAWGRQAHMRCWVETIKAHGPDSSELRDAYSEFVCVHA